MLALVALAAFSCAKEVELEKQVPVKEGFKLFAQTDEDVQPVTKTSLSESVNIIWNGDEKIKAYGIYPYESTGITCSNSNKNAEFTFGPIEDGDEIHYAIYPSANAGGDDEEHMTVTIPTEQEATANSFDPAAMASIGRVLDGNKIAFKNIGALLSLTIKNDNIESVELSATMESGAMTGASNVSINNEDVVSATTTGSANNVKLTGGLANGTKYYFVVYPGTYSNLKIVVTRSTDGYTATYRNKTSFTVGRNENWNIAELTVDPSKWVNPTPEPVKTAEFDPSGQLYGNSAYNESHDYGDWTIVNGANNNKAWGYYKMGGKSSTLGDANPCYIYNVNSFDGITKVTVSITDGSLSKTGMSVNSWGVYVYSNSTMTTQIDYVAGGTITNGTSKVYNFTPTSGTAWPDDSYFKVSWDLANTTNTNGIVCVDNITLYNIPVATPGSYSVTYNANGGTGDVPVDSNTYTDDIFTVTVLDNTLTRTGYSFTGWNTAADGSGRSYAVGDKFVITSDVTLYAQWAIQNYNVTWKVGSSTYHSDVVTIEDGLTLPTNPEPAAVGYDGKTFIGWTTATSVNSDGTSIVYAANGDAVTADVTYYAVFAEGSPTPASLAEVSSGYTLTAGDELVIVANDGEDDYGLYEETKNTSYVNNFAFTESVSDIADDAKKHWTVSKEDSNYYLGDSTNGYLYTSGSNNLTADTENKSAVTLGYNNTESAFTIVMNSRWLSLRSDLDGGNANLWRMGGASNKAANGTPYFKIYKFTPASGDYTNYTL